MTDEIKLTYLLFSVYLSVQCSLGPFGAILSGLSKLGLPVFLQKEKRVRMLHATIEYFVLIEEFYWFLCFLCLFGCFFCSFALN